MSAALDDAGFMVALLDIVIPPNGDVPGAGGLGLSPAVAEGLRGDPLLGPMVGPALESLRTATLAESGEGLAGMQPDGRLALVQEHASANPVLMMGLLRHLCPAYYALPQVLSAIGEEPRPPFPLGYEVEETDAGLLAILRKRATAPD
ncbi:MAG TPA: hypothetical protein VMR52_05210 [Dehalococcoidia bacterium]|nr:hypothetical protein [Dehalococcoidia bacterium]